MFLNRDDEKKKKIKKCYVGWGQGGGRWEGGRRGEDEWKKELSFFLPQYDWFCLL